MDTLKLFMAIPGKVNFLQMRSYGEFWSGVAGENRHKTLKPATLRQLGGTLQE